jgi:TusA-related sulfurtransferase
MIKEKILNSDLEPDHTLDVTKDLCPMTFVKTRLALDRLADGALLLVRLKGAEPLANVPRAASSLGHGVFVEAAGEDGVVRIFIKKNAPFI